MGRFWPFFFNSLQTPRARGRGGVDYRRPRFAASVGKEIQVCEYWRAACGSPIFTHLDRLTT